MKTTTYLRLSLLIPFLVWGICLLFFIIAGTMPETNELAFGESTNIAYLGIVFFAFYLFGIIIWIFPYILIALILFFLSFIREARVMIKLFALSPIAMTILTIGLMNVLTIINPGDGMLYSNPLSNIQDFTNFNILLVVVILIWAYICVGIGFGIYRLLQRRQFIRDEGNIESVPQPINQYE